MKIHIADDSDILRQHLYTIMSDIDGAEIVGESRDTHSTIRTINESKPELLILDIRMPGEGGIAALQIIKEQHPEIIIIIFTDYPYPQYRTKCMELGADYFFDKSTETEKMIETVKSIVMRHT